METSQRASQAQARMPSRAEGFKDLKKREKKKCNPPLTCGIITTCLQLWVHCDGMCLRGSRACWEL